MRNINYIFLMIFLINAGSTKSMRPEDFPQSMKRFAKKTAKKAKRNCRLMVNLITGKEPVEFIYKEQYLSDSESLDITSSECDPFDFIALPQDLQKEVIRLLIINNEAQNLNQSIGAILRLAAVSKAFYSLIKESNFAIVQIIQHLSQKFNADPATIAQIIGNQNAINFFNR